MGTLGQLRELAATNARRAIIMEKKGHLEDAIILYHRSISILKRIIKMERNKELKKIYEKRLKGYAKRVLKLLDEIKSKKSMGYGISKQKSEDSEEILEIVKDAIIIEKPRISWNDIAGLNQAKQALIEAAVWPLQRPDLFMGSRYPWRGILLFGPPGCGKTLLAKAVAANVNATFFNIDSATILSKWFGESEKIVREIFETARKKQPSIIFIDEVDALAGIRGESEHDALRRVKTVLLSQMDGLTSKKSDKLVVIAATNLPEILDPAFRRRFEKRIYVPPPDIHARKEIFKIHLRGIDLDSDVNFDKLAALTDGYTGHDIALVVREAVMKPIRDLARSGQLSNKDVKPRPVNMADFLEALKVVKPSLSKKEIEKYERWAQQYGTG